jgi:hypothetical protein
MHARIPLPAARDYDYVPIVKNPVITSGRNAASVFIGQLCNFYNNPVFICFAKFSEKIHRRVQTHQQKDAATATWPLINQLCGVEALAVM